MYLTAFILLIILLVIVVQSNKKKPAAVNAMPTGYKTILEEMVPFYIQLDEEKKKQFVERVEHFLSAVKITGIRTMVEDQDRVLIAASAVIPIFNFPGWEYRNLHEVLLYPDSFDHEFMQQGEGRNILGMVGTGAMNHIMILSQFELHQAFLNKTGKTNTAIHEFTHLLDKVDGEIDGLPEALMEKKYILPWLQLMQKEIALIKEDKSDIDPYGATNESEFFAVVAEYFFERPKLLEEKHPELYALLSKIFNAS